MRAFRRVPFLSILFAGLVMVIVTGCDSSGPSTTNGTVEVGFTTATSSGAQNTSATQTSSRSADSDPLTLTSSNGMLKISDIRLIVDKVKLKHTEVEIEQEVEVERPEFLDLPLQEAEVSPVAAGEVPPGTYNEFEFEVDDLDDDDGTNQGLRQDIRDEFPNWPEDASMIVVGTFTPTDGSSESFTAYFEAEIEVERMLSTPLEVTDDGFSRELVVKLDPARGFEQADGTIQDLSQFDFEETGQLVEFEAEFEEGVAEIEYGD
ncbi:MAG: hypothetical protein BRD30_08320 [Bacteroidetes bacterium QH_2_63_10]|nr:MAG: hypothetical protein BRD30_08320 [Bacteroidetes bacterium QH_2_63_10]